MPRVEILTIGDELVEGRLVDTNAAHLSAVLAGSALPVARHASVGDDREDIVSALRESAGRADVVLVSGGLGPTTDDLTAACAAEAFGLRIERHAEALEHVRAFFARVGRPMSPNNEKQADLPAGATLLPNPNGTALGFAVEASSCRLFFLPGVPRELEPMFADWILPELIERFSIRPPLVATLKVYGKGESDVGHLLEGLEDALEPPARLRIQYRASFPEIHVRLVLEEADGVTGRQQLAELAAQARRRLDGFVFAHGEEASTTTFGAAVRAALRRAGATLATVESITSGRVAGLIGPASDEFLGGLIEPEPTGSCEALARQVAHDRGATHGLAVLGRLPVEGTPGEVTIGIAAPGGPSSRRLSYPIDPERFATLAAYTGLHLLMRRL
jgi:nicotinamide-nucleotide amidase